MVATLLIQDGLDLDVQDNYGYTALMYAVESGQDDIAVGLIASGCDFERMGISGATASSIAVDFRRFAILNVLTSIKYKHAIERGAAYYWNRVHGHDGAMPDAVRAAERWRS